MYKFELAAVVESPFDKFQLPPLVVKASPAYLYVDSVSVSVNTGLFEESCNSVEGVAVPIPILVPLSYITESVNVFESDHFDT